VSAGTISLVAKLKTLPIPGLSRAQPAAPEPYLVSWKNYYQVLRVSPEADAKTIARAYQRLARIYRKLISPETQETRFFSQRTADTEEAYQVLSHKARRAAYDQTLKARAVSPETLPNEELGQLVELISRQVSEGRKWRLLRWNKVIQRLALTAILTIILVTAAGSSLALAKPESTLAAPFRGVIITLAELSGGAVSLIGEIHGVAAGFERQVVSTALQLMRVNEGLRMVPVVTAPTNDMAYFPSKEHCLFPNYLDRRYSQFKYTVDSNGIVSVDSSQTTTNTFLRKIELLLKQLSAAE